MAWSLEQVTSDSVRARFTELCHERPDIRVLRLIMGTPKALEWIHSVGVVQDEVLGSLVPPFPPVDLRRPTAAPEIEVFLYSGVKDIEQVMNLY